MKIISVVGARPNFMKIAPFVRAIQAHNDQRSKGASSIAVPSDRHRSGDAVGGGQMPSDPRPHVSGSSVPPSAASPEPATVGTGESRFPGGDSGVGPRPFTALRDAVPEPVEGAPCSELIEHVLVHTGQHYDDRMSRAFFEELGIPEADINLGIGSGSHAEQVGRTMIAFEKVVRETKPDWVVVVGDVNATCACSITAKKEHVKLAHIEAGLRSGDMDMPEEVNRLVTDRLSDLLFTPDRLSSANLRAEGVPEERIRFVGNIMIDTLEANRARAAALDLNAIIAANRLDGDRGRRPPTPAGTMGVSPPDPRPASLDSPDPTEPVLGNDGSSRSADTSVSTDTAQHPAGLGAGSAARAEPPGGGPALGACPTAYPHACDGVSEGTRPLGGGSGAGPRSSPFPLRYAVMTMHRPSNVDQAQTLVPIMEFLLSEVATEMPLLWPIHPRARKQLETFGLWSQAVACPNLILLEPLGYLEMLRLNMGAAVMLTDSGGLQEECCVLGTPCLTLRWNTERPITLAEHGGASVLVGNDVVRLRQAYRSAISQDRRPSCPELWDGHTAERIVAALATAGA